MVDIFIAMILLIETGFIVLPSYTTACKKLLQKKPTAGKHIFKLEFVAYYSL